VEGWHKKKMARIHGRERGSACAREGGGREGARKRESWWMGEEGERKIIEDEERGPEWEALSEV
jgi:hypothetical protein